MRLGCHGHGRGRQGKAHSWLTIAASFISIILNFKSIYPLSKSLLFHLLLGNRRRLRRMSKATKDEWIDFSDDSSDDGSVLGAAARMMKAQGKEQLDRIATNNKENPPVSRRPPASKAKGGEKPNARNVRKKKPNASSDKKGSGGRNAKNQRGGKAVAFKFGEVAGHRNRGRKRPNSPAGQPMVLSRRLSRKIMKASPLRSPIVAQELDFSSDVKVEKRSKMGSKKRAAGRPPRA